MQSRHDRHRTGDPVNMIEHEPLIEHIARLDWPAIAESVEIRGYAVLPALLSPQACDALIADSMQATAHENLDPFGAANGDSIGRATRSRTVLESTAVLRAALHPRVAPMASRWRRLLDPTSPFPFELVLLLSQPGRDFTGGELVMIEQRPRMQSRPVVIPLERGDVALRATRQRPIQGTHGVYRVRLSHAVGRVRGGERHAVEFQLDNGTPTYRYATHPSV
jgi:uncharacterized protein